MLVIKIFTNVNTYTVYRAALFHKGLFSIKLANFSPKSRNIQQQGASARISTKPTNL